MGTELNKPTELLPCPFCGNTNIKAWQYGNGFAIGCDRCAMHTHVRLPGDAIKNWNKRPGQDPPVPEINPEWKGFCEKDELKKGRCKEQCSECWEFQRK